jgi:hypothetical protein
MSESDLQLYFKNLCKDKDVLWRKIKFEGQRGCPDVLIANCGKLVLVELKNPNKKGVLSKLQKLQIQKLKKAGLDVRVLDNKEEINNVVREIVKC